MSFPRGDCINNVELILHTQPARFDEAIVFCDDLNEEARLTIPRSIDWFNQLLSLLDGTGENGNLWIGLEDIGDIGGSVAKRFLDIEGRPNPFTAVASEFPWVNGAPNDGNNDENCVASRGSDRLFDDFDCILETFTFVCERYCGIVPDNFIFDECVDGVQLFFNPNEQSFDAANADCEAFDSSAHLAIPTDANVFNRMQGFLQSIPGLQKDTFVGLRDFAEEGGLSTSRFLTMNGELLGFYNVGVGNFPWAAEEPNDFLAIQRCAAFNFDGAQLLDDKECLTSLTSLCQRPCVDEVENPAAPTQNPSTSPTIFVPAAALPTTSPSRSPTVVNELNEDSAVIIPLAIAAVVVLIIIVVLIVLLQKMKQKLKEVDFQYRVHSQFLDF